MQEGNYGQVPYPMQKEKKIGEEANGNTLLNPPTAVYST
jgi:hypothetical protein